MPEEFLNLNPTIAAIASGVGGGVGVIRVSGKDLSPFKTLTHKILQPRHATFSALYDENHHVLDYALLLYFPAPHSFTGEEVLEIHCHGGRVVLQMVLKRIIHLGARLAEPGEFTKRAFLNGKISLDEAESIADLINASTERAAQSAVRGLSKIFQKKIKLTVENLTQTRALLETTIDFADEDLDFTEKPVLKEKIASIFKNLQHLKNEVHTGVLLQAGIRVALVGEPNVGKSSLLNALSGEEIALVTEIAGTTRDALKSTLQIGGFPLHLVDTAGLRDDSADAIEKMGMQKTQEAIDSADVILLIGDAQIGKTPKMESLLKEFPENKKVLILMNKADLLAFVPPSSHNQLWVSAKTGAGLETLKNALLHLMGVEGDCEDAFIARARHLTAIEEALFHLQNAQNLDESELIAEELRLAQQKLFIITGEVTTEDLLDRIFSQFCVGK